MYLKNCQNWNDCTKKQKYLLRIGVNLCTKITFASLIGKKKKKAYALMFLYTNNRTSKQTVQF